MTGEDSRRRRSQAAALLYTDLRKLFLQGYAPKRLKAVHILVYGNA
jgi:hypothetical protein